MQQEIRLEWEKEQKMFCYSFLHWNLDTDVVQQALRLLKIYKLSNCVFFIEEVL